MSTAVSEHWLNGWCRNGGTVFMGSGIYCAGCGKSHGVVCVAIPADYVTIPTFDCPVKASSFSPEKLPDWPFPEKDCPVCRDSELYRFDSWPPRAVQLYIALRKSEAARAHDVDAKAEPGDLRLTHHVTLEIDVDMWDPRVGEWRWIGRLRPVAQKLSTADELGRTIVYRWCFDSADDTLHLGMWVTVMEAVDELQTHAVAGRL